MSTLFRLLSFPVITTVIAISLSSIAGWYSIQGLIAIFAASPVSIMIMGIALEAAKIVTVIWLHRYWNLASFIMKIYLVPALLSLMLITNLGVYGFLAKAHAEQTRISSDLMSKIAVYDEKISHLKETINTNKAALTQLNTQVDQLMSRTDTAGGINRAVFVRRQQATEREQLTNEIQAAQTEIARLNDEAAPIRAEIRHVEADVGPIKYIATLIYGTSTTTDMLEKAVSWITLLLVSVFEPLAIVLLIAAQQAYRWQKKEKENDTDSSILRPTTILDEPQRKDVHETSVDATYKDDITLEPNETIPSEKNQPAPKLDTNSTLPLIGPDYVEFGGKSVHINALREMKPELFVNDSSNATFGTSFPPIAARGSIYTRIDFMPHRKFRFNGAAWKEILDADDGIYNSEYLSYLVSLIEEGKYDVDFLSTKDKQEIERFLTSRDV